MLLVGGSGGVQVLHFQSMGLLEEQGYPYSKDFISSVYDACAPESPESPGESPPRCPPPPPPPPSTGRSCRVACP